MIYVIIFLIVNVFIGLLIVFISKDKIPYKQRETIKKNEYDAFQEEKVEYEEEELNKENQVKVEDEISIPINDEDEVNNLAKQLIPTPDNFSNPEKEAAKEMGQKVKEYFEGNPRDASKIFKTMLKKDN
tara:strand:+ start:1100 stop:1486 length:387 start_codon:yes stop_codon:yes gene_type:complete